MSKEALRNVLGFWHYHLQLEAKSPVLSEKAVHSPEALPWEERAEKQTRNLKAPYTVYAGSALAKVFWPIIEEQFWQENLIADREIYIYKLDLDENGMYIPQSLSIQAYLWAVAKLASREAEEALNLRQLDELCAQIDEELIASGRVIGSEIIIALSRSISKILLENSLQNQELFNTKEFIFDEANHPLLLQYKELEKKQLQELRKIASSIAPSDKESAILLSSVEERQAEVFSVEDTRVWKSNIHPSQFALATWPRQNPLTMSELWIANAFAQKEDSIQTYHVEDFQEKAKMLEELLAQTQVDRALALSRLHKVSDAFTMRRFQNSPENLASNFYAAIQSMKESLLTVSAADENVLESVANVLQEGNQNAYVRGYAAELKNSGEKETYFTPITKELQQKNQWAFQSTYIRNQEDLLRLIRACIQYVNPKNSYWDRLPAQGKVLSFQDAKKYFLDAKRKVEKKIASISLVADQAQVIIDLENEKRELLGKSNQLAKTIQDREEEKTELEEAKAKAEESFNWRTEDLEAYQMQMKGLNKWLYKLLHVGPYQSGMLSLEQKLDAAKREKESLKKKHQDLQFAMQEDTASKTLVDKQVQIRETRIVQLSEAEKENQAHFGQNYVDDAVLENITSENSQAISPWFDEELQALRESLFYRALQLNKSFIIHSTEVLSNLQKLEALLEGKFRLEEDKIDSLGDLLSTLRLVCPGLLISQSYLNEIEEFTGQRALGTVLFLDLENTRVEKLLPLLWRSNRLISVSNHLALKDQGAFYSPVDSEIQARFGIIEEERNIFRSAADALAKAKHNLFAYGNTGEKSLPLPFAVLRKGEAFTAVEELENEGLWNGLLSSNPKANPNHHSSSTGEMLIEESACLDCKDIPSEESQMTVQEEKALALVRSFWSEAKNVEDFAIYTLYPESRRNLQEHLLVLAEDIWGKNSTEMQTAQSWCLENVRLVQDAEKHASVREAFFLAGDALDLIEDLRDKDSQLVHTLCNLVSDKLLIITDKSVLAKLPHMDALCQSLSNKEVESEGKSKKLFLVPVEVKLEEDAVYPNADAYYTGPEDRSKIRMKKLYPEVWEIQTSSLFAFENTKNTYAISHENVEEFLEDLDRKGLASATIVSSQSHLESLFSSYFTEQEEQSLEEVRSITLVQDGKTWKREQ